MQGTQVRFERAELFDLPIHSVFLWMGRMYTVLDEESDDEGKIVCQVLAGGWTNNPDNRWLRAVGQKTDFVNCDVIALMYVADENFNPRLVQ